MVDYQPLAGLRGCCPAQSVKTPRLPCGAQNENCFLIMRYMQGDFGIVR